VPSPVNQLSRRKLSLSGIGAGLDNISQTCRIVGYSRQPFYEIRRYYQISETEVLIGRIPGPNGPRPNRMSGETEKATLE